MEQAVQDGMDLKTIPGIGDAISKKICEIIDTGRVQAYEKLEAELPQGILSLIKVPGIGPKTARLVAQELGATSIDELERATLDGRLSELPGLGDKAGENVPTGHPLCPAKARGKPQWRLLKKSKGNCPTFPVLSGTVLSIRWRG